MKSHPRFDVFVDLTATGFGHSEVAGFLYRLTDDAQLTRVAGQTTIALPADAEPPTVPLGTRLYTDPGRTATGLLERAILGAAASRRHLVVLLGAVVPGNEVVSALIEAFDRDPLFGSIQPRFSESITDHIWPLPGRRNGELAGSLISRTVLPFLPGQTITAELLAACIVLRWSLLAATDAVDHTYTTAAGALQQLLCQSRRRSLRNAVVNRVVVSSDLNSRQLYPVPSLEDLSRLRLAYPDDALAESENAGLTQRRLEPLLAAAHPGRGRRRRALLDCRGMGPQHNGTAQCVLGLLAGFAALDCDWQIDILVSRHAATYHRLAQAFPAFGYVYDEPSGEYSAAVGLSQPWVLGTVAELHRHALLVAFAMLDTISWDVLYPSWAVTAGTTWRFVARHVDGLLYISQFARERFKVRFPLDSRVAERVMHLSLRQDEHIDPAAEAEAGPDHDILVFGNDYDHKDLRATVQVLVDAFPLHRIVAFGLAESSAPNVTAVPSGLIGQTELHKLVAAARVIVYPSFYEGFGIPVVEGLAYGRPVVVRRSPLWAEIAGCSRLPGDLIEFDDVPSLVESVGRALIGSPGRTLPRGVRLADGEVPAGWRECASRVIALLNECLPTADGSRWQEREEALLVAGL